MIAGLSRLSRPGAGAALALLLPTFLLGFLISAQWGTQSDRPPIGTRYQFTLAEAAIDLQRQQRELRTQLVALRARMDAIQRQEAALGGRAAVLHAELQRLQVAAGLTPREGAGVIVTLDDARLPADTPIDTVRAAIVHSQDLTDVFNAAWKSGAEAIAVNGERITATTACVGAVIQINGTLLSPPFVISIIGPRERLFEGLSEPQELRDLKLRRAAFGLGFDIERAEILEVPAYSGPLDIRYARAR
ncbi:MAG: DUF881 domain-containing protein [Candidatus Limnocylindria bacterium]